MVKRKGQDTLVKAWPEVLRQHPDARLLLVGDGPNRTRVERLAARLGVAGSVVFAGSVPGEEVPAWIDAGDVFAMPCRSRKLGLEAEAFGIVFLEAAACGLPVLAGSSGGAAEAVRAPSSVVRRPSESDQVGQALLELLNAAARESRLPSTSREDDWDACAARLARLLSHRAQQDALGAALPRISSQESE
jgi:phosphatidylinositol alpha-1,6-mannosyltransferase